MKKRIKKTKKVKTPKIKKSKRNINFIKVYKTAILPIALLITFIAILVNKNLGGESIQIRIGVLLAMGASLFLVVLKHKKIFKIHNKVLKNAFKDFLAILTIFLLLGLLVSVTLYIFDESKSIEKKKLIVDLLLFVLTAITAFIYKLLGKPKIKFQNGNIENIANMKKRGIGYILIDVSILVGGIVMFFIGPMGTHHWAIFMTSVATLHLPISLMTLSGKNTFEPKQPNQKEKQEKHETNSFELEEDKTETIADLNFK